MPAGLSPLQLEPSPPASPPAVPRWTPLWVAGTYLGVGLLWVWASDRVPGGSVWGGAALVLGSGGLVYAAARREARPRGQLRAVTDGHPDAVFVKDRDGRYLLVNPAAARLSGKSVAEMLGRDDAALFAPELAARFTAADRRVTEAGTPETTEEDVPDGGDGRTLVTTKAPVRDAAGGVVGVVGIVRDVTDRARAERAVRESEDLYRATFELAGVGVAHVGLDGRFLRVNPRYADVLGYSRDELLGRTFQEVTHPDDVAPDLALVDELLAGQIPSYTLEKRYVRKGGDVVWVNLTASLRRGADGGPLHFIAVVKDVTARRAAEAAVRESEARFRTLVELLPDAVYINAGGRVAFCNPACVRLFGAAGPDDLLGKTPFDLYHPDDHDRIRGRIGRMLASGSPADEVEHRAVRLDGGEVPVFVRATPITDRGADAILVVLHDLTERKRVELRLRDQEYLLREAAELAHVGGWGFDPATGASDWTDEVARVHGLPAGTAPGVAAGVRFYVGEHQDRIAAAVAAAVDSGTPYDLELELETASGERRWVRTIGRPIVEGGRVVRVRGSLQDVTDRKRIEAEIHRLNADLEQRVRARTAELEAANKELEAFSYSVSHDLRAPLRAVDGFTRIVLDRFGAAMPAEAREYLGDVRAGAARMGRLVDDLLAFSRLARQPLRRQPVETKALVEACLKEVLRPHDGRAVEVRVGDLPPCDADPNLLRQVWLNLLGNAVKYSAARAPAVIEAGAVGGDGGPTFFVRDNGVGFDMRYAHKLFGVFQRLHRAEDYEGTGIGLALVQRIVHRHGGRVWADAAPDRGATFSFTLGGGGHAA